MGRKGISNIRWHSEKDCFRRVQVGRGKKKFGALIKVQSRNSELGQKGTRESQRFALSPAHLQSSVNVCISNTTRILPESCELSHCLFSAKTLVAVCLLKRTEFLYVPYWNSSTTSITADCCCGASPSVWPLYNLCVTSLWPIHTHNLQSQETLLQAIINSLVRFQKCFHA